MPRLWTFTFDSKSTYNSVGHNANILKRYIDVSDLHESVYHD